MFAKEQPRLIRNRHIVSKPAAAVKRPAMAAPNRKALQANNNRSALGDIGNLVGSLNAQCNITKDGVRKYPPNQKALQANSKRSALGDIGNLVGSLNAQGNSTKDGVRKCPPNQKALQANNNRSALGDIGNLVESLNSQCNITKDGVRKRVFGDIGNLIGALNAKCNISDDGRPRKRFRANLVVEANKGASSSTQQSPRGGAIVLRADAKAETGVVWGNKQARTIKTKDQYATALQKDTAINSDSIDSSAQDGGLKAPSQLKARKPRVQSMTATLTARSKDSLRDVCEGLPSIDDGDLENELAVVEYVGDIYKFYRKIENKSCVPPDYMAKQVEIEQKMRAILIDWLIEVHLKYNLMPETLYLTVNIVDRYLSVQSVTKKKLQLVGITAMLIASKYEEIWAPKVNDFVYISAREYTEKEIVDMEHTILDQLKFNLTVPTPYVFLVRFLKAAGPDKVMENLAFFMVDLCLLHYIMIKYNPSMIAAAAVYTAQCTLKKHPYWSKTLTLHTGYSEAELKECAHFMVNFHRNAGRNKLTVVHEKYSNPIFGSVASLSPANLTR